MDEAKRVAQLGLRARDKKKVELHVEGRRDLRENGRLPFRDVIMRLQKTVCRSSTITREQWIK